MDMKTLKTWTARALLLCAFVISGNAYADTAELNQGAPEGVILPLESIMEISEIGGAMIAPLAIGSWYDAGPGPGVLPFQGQFYYSDILSSYGSGYMNYIHYSWSGQTNGWANPLVYLLILDSSNNIVANANVTNSPTGGVSVPANTYPATYKVAYAFAVDQSPVLRIYNGPSYTWVTASVQYN